MNVEKGSQGHSQRLVAICASRDLVAGGLGVRFEVADESDTWPAFVIRHSEGLAAYINRCAHLALELDWNPGLFFDVDQRHLICATHGALYTADTDECVGGPCNESGLEVLKVVEKEGTDYLNDSYYARPCQQVKAGD